MLEPGPGGQPAAAMLETNRNLRQVLVSEQEFSGCAEISKLHGHMRLGHAVERVFPLPQRLLIRKAIPARLIDCCMPPSLSPDIFRAHPTVVPKPGSNRRRLRVHHLSDIGGKSLRLM